MSRRNQVTTDVVVTEPLHLKYRPKTLAEVKGQPEAIKSIKAALSAKARPHTYLFTGNAGTGKTTLARILANMLGVTTNNIVEVDAGSSGGVDVMREVMEPLRYHGFGDSPNKAVILDEAHMLSKQAWASLLKTVEEPPAHVFFFFCTTEASKVPQNIQTRCLAYNLRQVPMDDLLDLLDFVCDEEGLKVPDRILTMIAQAAEGSPRQALVYLAKLQDVEDQDEAARLLEAPLENKEIIDLCRQLIKGDLTWGRLTKTLSAMPEMTAESMRIVIVNYLSACLMKASDREATRLLSLLYPFRNPFQSSDKMAPLLLAFGDLIYD